MPFDHQAFFGVQAAVQRDMYSLQVTNKHVKQSAPYAAKQSQSNAVKSAAQTQKSIARAKARALVAVTF